MIKLLATDLDGTIYNRDNQFNVADIETLGLLGEKGITRVIATGRTFQSALSVLPENFPIDYLVFSSGAGIFNWATKTMLKVLNLGYENAQQIISILNDFNIEYTVHHPIPDNHIFFHSESDDPHPDFERYINFHRAHAIPEERNLPNEEYSQVIAFIPDMEVFVEIEKQFSDIKIVRATSPIDGESIWMEYFNKDVSKANGINWICNQLEIECSDVTVVGNDYNDLDMLHQFNNAFVVNNSPDEIKQKFTVLKNIEDAPLHDWLKRFSGLSLHQ